MTLAGWAGTALLALSATATLAGEHPYSGYYTGATDPKFPNGRDALACALTFSEQKPNGSFVSYHADVEKFRTSGTVEYLAYSSGQCGFESALSLETCTIGWSTDPSQAGTQIFTMIGNVNDAFVTAWIVTSRDDVVEYKKTGKLSRADRFALSRCRFDATALSSAMTGRKSDYSSESLWAIIQPNDQSLGDPLTHDIAKAMGLVQQ